MMLIQNWCRSELLDVSNLSESGLAFDYRMEWFDGVDVIRFVVVVVAAAAAAVVVGSSAVVVDIGATTTYCCCCCCCC